MYEERFEFESDGVSIVGVLRRPERLERAAVVTTGPSTSVKEEAAGAYATSLAERGFATLGFDHCTFGESGGGYTAQAVAQCRRSGLIGPASDSIAAFLTSAALEQA